MAHFDGYCRERALGLAQLSPQVLAAYHTRLLWQPHSEGRLYAPNSVDMGLRFVRAFLRWAVARGALRTDPAQDLVLGRPLRRPRPTWSRAEQDQIMALPDAALATGLRDRAILGLVLHTQLTWPQYAGLELTDFDPNSHRLVAERGRVRSGPRVLILSDELAALLTVYLRDGRPRPKPDPGELGLFLVAGRRMKTFHVGQTARAYLHRAKAAGFPLTDGL